MNVEKVAGAYGEPTTCLSGRDDKRCHLLPSESKSGDCWVPMLPLMDVGYIILLDRISDPNDGADRER